MTKMLEASVSILNIDTKLEHIKTVPRKKYMPKEVVYEKLELGSRLVDYIPIEDMKPMRIFNNSNSDNENKEIINTEETPEEIIKRMIKKLNSGEMKFSDNGSNNWEQTFKQLLYVYITLCLRDKSFYNENKFLEIFAMNNLNLPRIRISKRFAEDDLYYPAFAPENVDMQEIKHHLENDYGYYREYYIYNDDEWKIKTNYYMAILNELIKHKYTINKCKNCGKWFVAFSKSDQKYCNRISPQIKNKTCKDAVRYERQQTRIYYKYCYDSLYNKGSIKATEYLDVLVNEYADYKLKVKEGFKTYTNFLVWIKEKRKEVKKVIKQ